MRAIVGILLGLLLGLAPAFAQDDDDASPAPAKDPWLGCWTHIYDAAHLAKHQGQRVAAMTVQVASRTPQGDTDHGNYLAKVSAKLRDKQDNYSNLDGARCQLAGSAKDHLVCSGAGIFVGQFSLAQAGKNLKLALASPDQNLALVPGIDPSGVVMLTADNPEHALFLLQPAPPGTCKP